MAAPQPVRCLKRSLSASPSTRAGCVQRIGARSNQRRNPLLRASRASCIGARDWRPSVLCALRARHTRANRKGAIDVRISDARGRRHAIAIVPHGIAHERGGVDAWGDDRRHERIAVVGTAWEPRRRRSACRPARPASFGVQSQGATICPKKCDYSQLVYSASTRINPT
jgi:hypothetical protein